MCNKIISKGILAAVAVSVLLSGMVLGCKQATGGDDTPIETIRWAVSSGSYEFKTNDSQYYNYYFAHVLSDPATASQDISVSATKLSGSKYYGVGMVCFGQAGEKMNGYIILCDPNGSYFVGKYKDDVFSVVIDWVHSGHINTAYGAENVLTVKQAGSLNMYDLYINTYQVNSFKNEDFTSGGYYGFYCDVGKAANGESFPGTPVDARFKMLSPITAP